MEARVEKEVRVVLTVSLEEARYIQELVQNVFGNPEDEPPEYTKYRKDIFNTIKNIIS